MSRNFWVKVILIAIVIALAIFLLPKTRVLSVQNIKAVFNFPEPKVDQVSFIIGGDMMFARGIHAQYESNLAESVSGLGDIFAPADARIVNLEGAISATPVKPDPSPHFKFVFPPQTVDVLRDLGINAVSQDNNHASNGDAATTKSLLEKQGIAVLPATFQGDGLKLTVIGVHTLWGVRDIKDQIIEIKTDPDQRVIVFAHWGLEYEVIHSPGQEQLARAWIDAGADAVIGAHPHVVQDISFYKDKPIIYSLGNLLFDQKWSEQTQKGILVKGIFYDDSLELSVMPVISKNNQPMLGSSQWIPLSSWILGRR